MLRLIAEDIAARGGRAYYVGGYVRNLLMRNDPAEGEDIDIEVFCLGMEELKSLLSRYGNTKLVGKSFPVLKISGHPEWDFILPVNPGVSLADACARRDFTINAMMMDVLSGEIIDYYGGRKDISDHVIKHTSPTVFALDPLRVYRAMHFASRFSFSIHPATVELIAKTDLSPVSRERIYEEIRKLLMLSPRPSIGLRYLQETGVLKRMHPLLFELIGCVQSPRNHPEGDVWEHTLLVVDQAARLKSSSSNPTALMFAALLHDIGKPGTTRIRGDKVTTYGHDVLGEKLARSFLQELTRNRALINQTTLLVREHMHPILLYKDRQNVGDKAILKLMNRVNLQELLLIAEADFLGRHGERDFEVIRKWFKEKVAGLGLDPEQKIDPLVKGRDLLQIGIQPGPAYKILLDRALDLQLEGQTKQAILENIRRSQAR